MELFGCFGSRYTWERDGNIELWWSAMSTHLDFFWTRNFIQLYAITNCQKKKKKINRTFQQPKVKIVNSVYVLVVVGPPVDHWLLMEASSFFFDLRLPPMTTTSLWPPSCPIFCPCSVSFAHLKRSRHLIRTDPSEEGEIFVTVWAVEVKIFPLSSFHSPSSCASFLHARTPRRNQSYSTGRVTNICQFQLILRFHIYNGVLWFYVEP